MSNMNDEEINATGVLSSHFITHVDGQQESHFSVYPKAAAESLELEQEENAQEAANGKYEPYNTEPGRLPCAFPSVSTPFKNRSVVEYEPQGYMHIGPRHKQDWKFDIEAIHSDKKSVYDEDIGEEILMATDKAPAAAAAANYVTPETFQRIAEGFKGGDGKFLAMTAYGAVPLPDEILKKIPEKFQTKPLFQEREVFVLKQEEKIRVSEQDYTEFDHTFKPRPASITVNKIEPVENVKVLEIPHFKYSPTIEERNIDIPAGIKYVEVPIEVVCRTPPRIIPIIKPHIIERVIETTKPVVQEKIVEVPEIVKKKVPRIVTKEVPYVVAKYVEKIIEVPYQSGRDLPAPRGRPMSLIPKPPVHLKSQKQNSMSARVEDDALIVDDYKDSATPQTFYLSNDIQHIKLPFEAKIDISIVEAKEVPAGAAIAQRGVRYVPPGRRSYNGDSPNGDDAIYAGPMDPIIEHATPGMRAVDFRTRSDEPDILTQRGVLKFSKFKSSLHHDVSQLIPNLPQHELVPMDPEGTPDLKGLTFVHSQHAARISNAITNN